MTLLTEYTCRTVNAHILFTVIFLVMYIYQVFFYTCKCLLCPNWYKLKSIQALTSHKAMTIYGSELTKPVRITSQKTQRQTEAKAIAIIKPQGRCEYSVTN